MLKIEAKWRIIKPPVPLLLNLSPTGIHPFSSFLGQDLQPCIFILCKHAVSSLANLQLNAMNCTHAGPLPTLVTEGFLLLVLSGVHVLASVTGKFKTPVKLLRCPCPLSWDSGCRLRKRNPIYWTPKTHSSKKATWMFPLWKCLKRKGRLLC